MKVVIPVEIEEPSRKTEAPPDEKMNDVALQEELDPVEEIRMGAALREASLKQKVTITTMPRSYDESSWSKALS